LVVHLSQADVGVVLEQAKAVSFAGMALNLSFFVFRLEEVYRFSHTQDVVVVVDSVW